MEKQQKDYSLRDVVQAEQEQLRLRREKLGLPIEPEGRERWFGIALSGGGIRSATINMGFLKTLNRYGVLQRADYLSTVSGGGYTHSYVQATLKEKEDFKQLFTDEHIDTMRQHGDYLIPGRGGLKSFNTFLLLVSFVVSWIMSMVSPAIVVGIVYWLYRTAISFNWVNPIPKLGTVLSGEFWQEGLVVVLALLLAHLLANISLNFSLNISKIFNRIEAVIALVLMFFAGWYVVGNVELTSDPNLKAAASVSDVPYFLGYALALVVVGFFLNPNALSFHRYYRKQLADLYLRFAPGFNNLPLKDVFNAHSTDKKDYIGPYPIINTCLNLLAPEGDEKFKGSKASDYFLLSPLFCGSKLTAYVPTNAYWDYKRMTLPAAVTISAAAVNPGMGMYSNRFLSAMMTIFNVRLGFWISNPLILKRSYAIVWWPLYFFKELRGRIGTNNKLVNISDGGHIENLGVYELLRRQCRLIVSVDAGEDGKYAFFDLNNLLIRARNELGYEIRFRPDQQPESLIVPQPSSVYSKQRFAVADIYQHWIDEKVPDEKTGELVSRIVNFPKPRKTGTFVYVKSSVTAPKGKPFLSERDDPLRYGTYKYKIYHPDFPHETTGDQFFDPIQWEAYFQLGQFIGADVLGLDKPHQHEGEVSVDQLIALFDENIGLFPPADASAADEMESTRGATRTTTAPPTAAEYHM
jgi:hypothetical protein